MYEFILDQKLLTAGAGLLLSVLASLVAGAPRLWWRGITFSFSPTIAAAFFLVAGLAPVNAPMLDLAGGLLLEFTVLCLFFVALNLLVDMAQPLLDPRMKRA